MIESENDHMFDHLQTPDPDLSSSSSESLPALERRNGLSGVSLSAEPLLEENLPYTELTDKLPWLCAPARVTGPQRCRCPHRMCQARWGRGQTEPPHPKQLRPED